jgi:hypothetical protein
MGAERDGFTWQPAMALRPTAGYAALAGGVQDVAYEVASGFSPGRPMFQTVRRS